MMMQAGGTPPGSSEYNTRGDLRKIAGILVALALFIAVLLVYIIPLQGGFISSTAIRAGDLTGTEPRFQEQLPIQEVDLGASGRSIFIAFVMLTHILFANLHLGGAWVLLSLVILYLVSRKERYSRLGKSVALFNVILFSAGATFAATGVLFFIALYPTFATQAFHIYWWPLLVEAILFGVEIFFVYTLWFTWARVGAAWHVLLAIGYPVSIFFQTLAIDTFVSGMLTPGAKTITWGAPGLLGMPWAEYLLWWFNATLWPLQFHRVAAATSFFGFLLAFLAMLHFLDRTDPPSRKYWDWVGSFGILWGLLGLIIQPVLGLWYMYSIFTHQNQAFTNIMTGPRAWEMLLMVGLLSLLIVTVSVYFIERRERLLVRLGRHDIRNLFRAFAIIAGAAGLVLVQPAWLGGIMQYDPGTWLNPLGLMYYKHIALLVLITIGAIIIGIDLLVLRGRGTRSGATSPGHPGWRRSSQVCSAHGSSLSWGMLGSRRAPRGCSTRSSRCREDRPTRRRCRPIRSSRSG
ncbi:cytochrome ubiquinol oxidase subunit I [Methanoculleus bourgensis]|uniref:Putative Cytochrome bd-type quinol oxidase subunit 1-like protein n=1 Tax=Methanoculleus bourgensis TaxID=83986 RepID=A0A0X3BRQ7_9EURY|nr:cytochrome ubiquinol oxidase subunit I [Methanoculleus bourgensis]CVK34234.1 putative Cytochrome bd-type quinol oxidase subunit 1-like protein [Methanoculleus bourgensis]